MTFNLVRLVVSVTVHLFFLVSALVYNYQDRPADEAASLAWAILAYLVAKDALKQLYEEESK